jgi:hypothetical protein
MTNKAPAFVSSCTFAPPEDDVESINIPFLLIK